MKVAYNEGSGSHFFLSVLLRENGMTEKDIRGVNMRPDDAWPALIRHQLDAAVTWEPWLTRAKTAPDSHVLVDSSSRPGLLMDVWVFRREILTAHPDAVRAVIDGWHRAVDYWKSYPDESDVRMAKAIGCWPQDLQAFKRALEGVRFYDEVTNQRYLAPNGVAYATAQKALEVWRALGKITSGATSADLIDPDFVKR